MEARTHAVDTFSDFGRICKMSDRMDGKRFATGLMSKRDIYTETIKHGRQYEQRALDAY